MLERLDNRQRCVVHVLVERLAPDKRRVCDPCCGSAGVFVRSEKFVDEYGGRIDVIALCGRESNSTRRRLAMMIAYSEVVTICDHNDELLTRRTP